MDVNWRRAFAVSSLLMALLLIAGSIYLHLRQKHHFGRMRLEQRDIVVPLDGVEAAEITVLPTTTTTTTTETTLTPCPVCQSVLEGNDNDKRPPPPMADDTQSTSTGKSNNNNKDNNMHIGNTSTSSSNSSTVTSTPTPFSINEMCLQCICVTATECKPTTCTSSNDSCGVYRISRRYWHDAGEPTLDGDESIVDNFDAGYQHCVTNAYCAARTVIAYVSKYVRDCNHDGKIDCRDYIAMHVLGPSGCLQQELTPIYEYRMENCFKTYGL